MLRTDKKGKWFEIHIPEKWDGLTVEDLFHKIWSAPKKLTHFFRMENRVLLNGIKANWSTPFLKGDKLQLAFFEDEESTVPPSFLEVPILFEDDHIIVFNKPPFMNTHPNHDETDTLLNAAVFHLLANGEVRNVRHIHRLDRETSGAILFAKHALAGAILDRMLEKREIKRTYLAIAHGLIKQNKGTIQKPIGRDRHHATRRRVSPSGQEAVTHYQVIKKIKEKQLTYIKCWLDTGRTHQIRVHLESLGYPLAGDTLYGGEPIFPRQALHAAKLEFVHPLTEEKLVCHAPFLDKPPIFERLNINEI